MMDGTTVERIADLARQGQTVEQLVQQIGDHTFTTVPLHHLPLKAEPHPPVLQVSSLHALVDYVQANRDGIDLATCVVHVESPTAVHLLGPITGEKRQRFTYATATAEDLVAGFLGQYHSQPQFIVALQSRFVKMYDRATVLELVGKLKEEQSLETEDDGVTQRATARSGIHLAQQVSIPNPIELAPFRTFREIEQPASAFVLRVQSGARAALYEADGGAWKIDAVESLASWLGEHLPENLPVLA